MLSLQYLQSGIKCNGSGCFFLKDGYSKRGHVHTEKPKLLIESQLTSITVQANLNRLDICRVVVLELDAITRGKFLRLVSLNICTDDVASQEFADYGLYIWSGEG